MVTRRTMFALIMGLIATTAGCACDGTGGDACVPLACSEAGANCGEVDDGCGGALHCGYCGGGSTCGGGGTPNRCGGGSCVPDDCASMGALCGAAPDGCGGTVRCGYCPAGLTCGGGDQAFACGLGASCTPRTCAQTGADCGRTPDGCGGVLDCGGCAAGLTCGGGGANVCGTGTCTPTAECLARHCGLTSDGCSEARDCGGCAATEVCWRGSECRTASVGGGCGSDADCAAGVCLTPDQGGWADGYCSTWCDQDDDCGAGNVCWRAAGRSQGVCLAGCTSNLDCGRPGYRCQDPDGDGRQTCLPSGTGTGTVGDPCTSLADCAGDTRAVCLGEGEGLPGGYCSVLCGGSDSACPVGTHCALGSAGAVCLRDCSDASQCRTGYACTDWDADGRSECVPAAGGGEPCSHPSECSTGYCRTQEQSGWTGGACTLPCQVDGDCGTGTRCASDGTGRYCLPTCASSQDCRTGYACYDPGDGRGTVCGPWGGGGGGTGAPCTSVADCAGGADARCVSGAEGGFCSAICQSDGDCPEGDRCRPLGGDAAMGCLVGCDTEEDCGYGQTCDPAAGVCKPGDPPIVVGGACTAASGCVEGLCFVELYTGWLGGYCTTDCDQVVRCPAGSHCGYLTQDSEGMAEGICLADCGGCRTGYRCWDADGDGTSECAAWAGGTRPVGEPCATLDQCAGAEQGVCLLGAEGWPAGYCALDCAGASCPTGTTCSIEGERRLCLDSVCCAAYRTCVVDELLNDSCAAPEVCRIDTPAPEGAPGGTGICADPFKPCSPTLSCPGGYVCSDDAGGVCLGCDSSSQCRDDYTCFDLAGDGVRECRPAGKGPGAPGQGCRDVGDCVGGVRAVCLEAGTVYPEGYCTIDCSRGDPCPGGSVCTRVPDYQDDGTVEYDAWCLDTCSGQADCGTGYRCYAVEPGMPPVCWP